MLKLLYSTYFDKHKPLRHYTQHFLVASVGFFISRSIFHLPIDAPEIIVFLLFSYIVDLDGVISLLTTSRNIPQAKEILHAIKINQYSKAAILATTHHKKFNRLILHNVFGFIGVLAILTVSLYTHNQLGINASSAIVSHFTFDILDDVYQLGHVKNWLWPIQ